MYNDQIENEINPVTRWKNEFSKQKYGKRQIHGCRWTKRLNKKWILQLSYFVLKAAETAESAQSYAIKFIILNLIL